MFKLKKVKKTRQIDRQLCLHRRVRKIKDRQMYKLTKVRKVRVIQTDRQAGVNTHQGEGERQTDRKMYKLTKVRGVRDRQPGVQQGHRQTN